MKTFLAVLTCAALLSVRAADSTPLSVAQTIPLPGVQGRFDHFAIDTKGHRLFVAALGNDTLEVLDIAAGKHIKSITGLHKPTGVAFLPEVNQIGVANGDDGTFKLFDGASYELVNTLPGLDDADNVRRDEKTRLIYVGYGEGALAVLNSGGRKKIGDIKLSRHPESFQLEHDGTRIFVNIPEAKIVAVLDRTKREVVAQWPMHKFQANFPMALEGDRLFVGCRNPARLVVLDAKSGKNVADAEISGDPDDLFYDTKRQRLYVSCGEGFVDVIQRRKADHYEHIARVPSRNGARTSFFSSELDRLYVALPQRGAQSAELRIYQPE